MDEHLDLIRHNKDTISIRDMNNDLDISQAKWNDIFEYLLEQTSYVYFQGLRRWVEDDDFTNTITNISEEILVDKDRIILLCRLKTNVLMFSRTQLNKMFYYYEYPMLVFLKYDRQEVSLIKYTEKLPLGDMPLTNLPHLFTASRDSQLDVLWLRKSSDMHFPWETRRSPAALEEEDSAPWYKKLLNKMGFYWDIKINRKEE